MLVILEQERTREMIDYNNMKVLFIVLSLAAVLLLPIKRLNRSQKFAYPPRLRDPEELRGNRISSSISRSIHQDINRQFCC